MTRRVAVLPVGIDLERFRPIPRAEARERLGLDPDGPYLLFPHDPVRPLKRYDRAVEAAGDVPLLTLGGVAPDEVPYWINAANAVLVPSAAEGFGLSVIEALACGVPAFGTPVGIHPVALQGIEGAYCAEWDRDAWREALRRTWRRPIRASTDALERSCSRADAMAARVVEAWHDLLASHLNDPLNRVVGAEADPILDSPGPRADEGPRRPMSGLFKRLSSRRSAGPEGSEPQQATGPGAADATHSRRAGGPSVPAHRPGRPDARAPRGRAADAA